MKNKLKVPKERLVEALSKEAIEAFKGKDCYYTFHKGIVLNGELRR